MHHRITIAEARNGQKVWLEYADGEAGEVDFGPLIARGGVFATLANPSIIGAVRVGDDGRYIEFPGDLDFCADALREKLTRITAANR